MTMEGNMFKHIKNDPFFSLQYHPFKAHKHIATDEVMAIIDSNNTPPATRKISALRGVTCFWECVK